MIVIKTRDLKFDYTISATWVGKILLKVHWFSK